MSDCAFANRTIDHLRRYGIRMHRDEWAALRIYLEAQAADIRGDERRRLTERLRWHAEHRPEPTRQRIHEAADDLVAWANP